MRELHCEQEFADKRRLREFESKENTSEVSLFKEKNVEDVLEFKLNFKKISYLKNLPIKLFRFK